MTSPISVLNPARLAQPNGFSQVAIDNRNGTVFISGQVAYDAQGSIVGVNDLAAQTRQVLQNLQTALAEAGSDFRHTLKLNFYVKNLSEEAVAIIRKERAPFLPQDQLPASTLVGVSALAKEDLLLEVEAYAVRKST